MAVSVATDARSEFEQMMRIGDEAILAGRAPGLLEGQQAAEAQVAAEAYRHRVEQLEESEGLRWDGERHVPR